MKKNYCILVLTFLCMLCGQGSYSMTEMEGNGFEDNYGSLEQIISEFTNAGIDVNVYITEADVERFWADHPGFSQSYESHNLSSDELEAYLIGNPYATYTYVGNGGGTDFFLVNIPNGINFGGGTPQGNTENNTESTNQSTQESFLIGIPSDPSTQTTMPPEYYEYCSYYPDQCPELYPDGTNSSGDGNGYTNTSIYPAPPEITIEIVEGEDGGEEYKIDNYTNFNPPTQTLPGRNEFYAAFPKIGTSGMTADNVYRLVGGTILNSRMQNPNRYQNACAIRVSRALNYTGKTIPVFYNNNGEQRTQKGGDDLNYILDAASLLAYMQKTFKNNPPVKFTDKTPSQVKAYLNGKWGIYIMIPKDRSTFNASGHADFWSYSGCLSGDYLDKAKEVYFWELK